MRGAEGAAWGLAAVGLLGSALGWALAPALFPHAWLSAVVWWSGWPLGSLALLLVHALTGGRWGEALRPGLLAGISTLPLMLPAIVPVLLLLPELYPWAQAGAPAPHNRFYLNTPFFAARGVVYLVAWFGLAGLALRLRDRPGLVRLAPPGLILLAFTVTFAAVDLTESLDPGFNSSAWGMVAAAGMALLALSLGILFAPGPDPAALPDLGKLLLALVVLWAYLDFMQFLIVWASNLAHDAPWYARRLRDGWDWAIGFATAGHVLLPFAVLLFPPLQRRRAAVAGVAAVLVAAAVLRAWWIVLPEAGRGLSWLDPFPVLGLGGAALGLALRGRRAHRHLGVPRHA